MWLSLAWIFGASLLVIGGVGSLISEETLQKLLARRAESRDLDFDRTAAESLSMWTIAPTKR